MLTAFTMPDWEVGNPSAKTGAMPVVFQDQDHALYTFEIEVRRRWSYYVFQIVLPLTLIFAMSWAVFWIDPTYFAPKISLPATAMLTVIAFHFTARNMLPRISYLTVLDWFVLGATSLVFMGLLMSLATTYLVANDRLPSAKRLDRHCRWLFPGGFLVLNAAVLVL